jgi:hypothetical protein
MTRSRVWVIALAMAAAVSGVAAQDNFRTVDIGVYSGVQDSREAVIRTPAAWRALWAEHVSTRTPPPPAPSIDFSRLMVIAVFMGTRPTGGYRIEVRNVTMSHGELVVSVRRTEPPRGSIVAQVLTQPYHIIVLPRTNAPVRFVPVR